MSTGSSVVGLTLKIRPTGLVHEAKVIDAGGMGQSGGGANRGGKGGGNDGGLSVAIACTERAAKSIRFATFCGEDVEIRWSYSLQ
ncbi:MAG: hypothetical protein NVSMB1_19040 [Polyangiales bacterium]